MSARVRNFPLLFSYSYFFLLTPMCSEVSANPVYRLTLSVSDQKYSGTDMSVEVKLHSHTSSILKLLNGNETPFFRNRTLTFRLLPSDTKDIGPICRVDLQLCSLNENNTHQFCSEIDGAKVLILKKFTVTYIIKDDVGIFIPNTSRKTDVDIGVKSKQLERADTMWGPWDDCSCETSKRTRRRFVPSCGGVAERHETESEQCVSISKICDSQMTYIIVGSVLGSVALVMVSIATIFGVKKCSNSSPTIHIQMSPNNEGPVTSLRPELGSTLTLDVIRPYPRDVSPVPSHRMLVPYTTPKLKLLEEGDYFDPRAYASSALSSVESYDYDGIYYS